MISISIKRKWYTAKSISSTLTVSSDKTTKSFSGYALENSHAGAHGGKTPTLPGTYTAKTRSDGKLGWRIELFGVVGHSHIEIHAGNYPWDSHGCFLPGTSRAADRVWHSQHAMHEIRAVVDADASAVISVNVIGRAEEHAALDFHAHGLCWPDVRLWQFGRQTPGLDRCLPPYL